MNLICTIVARQGSKGVPGKNWKTIAGKPLFLHTLELARDSGLFESIVVSSDAPEIINNALNYGATHVVVRNTDLASDTAGKVPSIIDAVHRVEKQENTSFDLVVDLDVTSPLRNLDDLKGAINLLITHEIDSVVTATESRRSPYFNLLEIDSHTKSVSVSKPLKSKILRRQDAPECFDMNASIYVWKKSALFAQEQVFFENTKIFVMPPERSLDIDSELDFQIVEWLMERKK
jgi:CMP-N-acetylneuraminic acid synthetase